MKKRNIVVMGTIILISFVCIFWYHWQPKQSRDKAVHVAKEVDSKKNAFSHLSYYHSKYLDRYQDYQKKNPKKSIEDIVTYVNIGLDLGFYNHIKTVKNPDAINVVVNKLHKLPDEWNPKNLVQVNPQRDEYLEKRAAKAFFSFRDACQKQGFSITAFSGFRSYQHQERNYHNMIQAQGQEQTDRYVSRPGHSEHNTGLCVDISIDGIYYEDIDQSPYYSWFREHMVEYGFILRYPENKQAITGYHYECWHIRYLGKQLAKKVKNSGLTFEEYQARQ